MGIYYHPPQPTQAAAHVPIPAQGDSPPPLMRRALTWRTQSWDVQRAATSTAWNITAEPAAQVPASSLALAIRLAWWSEYPWPVQRRLIAPLTLVYGDQPPPLAQRAFAWRMPSWEAQRAAPNAAWNITAAEAVQVQGSILAWAIWHAWRGEDPLRVQQRFIAPLTLIYGDQPPLPRARDPLTAWFEIGWALPHGAPNAGWNVPVVVGQVPPTLWPWQLWHAWVAQPIERQALPHIAPLTLVYGDQPPPRVLAAAWQTLSQYREPIWPAQFATPTAAWNIPPFVPGDAPPPKVSAAQWQALATWFEQTWPAQHPAANASWNFYLTPAGRVLAVNADNRVLVITADGRVLAIHEDDRTLPIILQ